MGYNLDTPSSELAERYGKQECFPIRKMIYFQGGFFTSKFTGGWVYVYIYIYIHINIRKQCVDKHMQRIHIKPGNRLYTSWRHRSHRSRDSPFQGRRQVFQSLALRVDETAQVALTGARVALGTLGVGWPWWPSDVAMVFTFNHHESSRNPWDFWRILDEPDLGMWQRRKVPK